MNRPMFLLMSVALASVAALVPVLVSVRVAEQEADRREQEHLHAFTRAAVLRIERVMTDAIQGLQEMEAQTDPPCSPGNLLALRRVAFTYRYVKDAGRRVGNTRLCSALLGDAYGRGLTLPEQDWQGLDGLEYWFSVRNPFGAPRPELLVGRSGHYVSLDPQSMVDVVDLERRDLAAVSLGTGRLVAAKAGTDPVEMERQYADPSARDNSHYYAVVRSASMPFAVVTRAPRGRLVSNWPLLLGLCILTGLAIGTAAGALTLRLVSHRFSLEWALRNAVKRRQISVHFQPIIALADPRCVGAEALLRWQHNGEMVSPELLLSVAGRAGLMAQITDQVLDNVLQDLGDWLRSHPDFYVSVNVDVQDLKARRFVDVLSARLSGTGIGARQIRIEITEHAFLEAEAARGIIQAFRDAGHPVYIDDFGTGYSSLSYLQNFKVDALKIDKSFTDTIGRDAASSTVAPHIISMAHELGFEVVAEGVEHEAQARYLKEHGAQYAQGWLYSRALPADALVGFLERWHPVPGAA
ncbi:histidine kinase [Cupriavidus pinatubonensis]|nr:histidine kinase [Cupriavidus pinatubonensis]